MGIFSLGRFWWLDYTTWFYFWADCQKAFISIWSTNGIRGVCLKLIIINNDNDDNKITDIVLYIKVLYTGVVLVPVSLFSLWFLLGRNFGLEQDWNRHNTSLFAPCLVMLDTPSCSLTSVILLISCPFGLLVWHIEASKREWGACPPEMFLHLSHTRCNLGTLSIQVCWHLIWFQSMQEIWRVNWSTWHKHGSKKNLSPQQELNPWPPEYQGAFYPLSHENSWLARSFNSVQQMLKNLQVFAPCKWRQGEVGPSQTIAYGRTGVFSWCVITVADFICCEIWI